MGHSTRRVIKTPQELSDFVSKFGTTLHDTNFEGSFIGTAFKGYDLKRCVFKGNFMGADFSNAILTKADLRQGIFQAALFTSADLSHAKLAGGDFLKAIFTDVKKSNSPSTNLQGADLSQGTFQGANFTGADLHGANMTSGNFLDAIFANAVVDVSFFQAIRGVPAHLPNRPNFQEANFSRANLTGVKI